MKSFVLRTLLVACAFGLVGIACALTIGVPMPTALGGVLVFGFLGFFIGVLICASIEGGAVAA